MSPPPPYRVVSARKRLMDTRNVLRMAGIAAVLICLILLIIPTSRSFQSMELDCGSVVSQSAMPTVERRKACDISHNNRLTISLVIGAVGVAAFFGASKVKKREGE